jgi:hypothetical protein
LACSTMHIALRPTRARDTDSRQRTSGSSASTARCATQLAAITSELRYRSALRSESVRAASATRARARHLVPARLPSYPPHSRVVPASASRRRPLH